MLRVALSRAASACYRLGRQVTTGVPVAPMWTWPGYYGVGIEDSFPEYTSGPPGAYYCFARTVVRLVARQRILDAPGGASCVELQRTPA